MGQGGRPQISAPAPPSSGAEAPRCHARSPASTVTVPHHPSPVPHPHYPSPLPHPHHPSPLPQPLVLFVASTTGTGVEPDNMRQFWRFLLRKNLPSDSLARLRFSVFGLGDSGYPKFNFAAKKLHKRLESLGATCCYPLGLADDQHDLGVDGALEPWLEGVWARVLQLCVTVACPGSSIIRVSSRTCILQITLDTIMPLTLQPQPCVFPASLPSCARPLSSRAAHANGVMR